MDWIDEDSASLKFIWEMSSLVSGSHECKFLSLYETKVLYLNSK